MRVHNAYDEPAPSIRVGELLRSALAVFSVHPGVLLTMGLLLTAPFELLAHVMAQTSPSRHLAISLLGSATVQLIRSLGVALLGGCVMRLVLLHAAGERVTLGASLRGCLSRAPGLIAAALIVSVVTKIGFLMLVVPGMIALLTAALVVPVVTVERLGPIAAWRRSARLMRGHWFVFFLAALAMMVPEVVLKSLRFALRAAPLELTASGVLDAFLSWVTYGVLDLIFALIVATIYLAVVTRREQADPKSLALGPTPSSP